MKRREFIVLLGGVVAPLGVHAQGTARNPSTTNFHFALGAIGLHDVRFLGVKPTYR